jgi:hypothetical protein
VQKPNLRSTRAEFAAETLGLIQPAEEFVSTAEANQQRNKLNQARRA